MRELYIFLFIFLMSLSLCAEGDLMRSEIENDNSFNEIKKIQKTIDSLSRVEDIFAVNKLLNNNFDVLDKKYILRVFMQNVEVCKRKKKRILLSDTYLSLGTYWELENNESLAREYYIFAEAEARYIGDSLGIGIALLNLSTLQHNSKKTISQIIESLTYLKKANSTHNLSIAYLSLGNEYFNLSKLDVANYYYQVAEKYLSEVSYPAGQAALYLNMGRVEALRNQSKKASMYYEKALHIFSANQLFRGVTYCYLYQGNLKVQNKQYTEALPFFNQALQIAEKNAIRSSSDEIYLQLANVYGNLKNYEKAFYYSQKQNQVLKYSDSLNLYREGVKDLAYTHYKQLEYIQHLETKQTIQKIYTTTSIIIIVLLLLFGGLVLAFQRRKIYQNKLLLSQTQRLNLTQKELLDSQLAKEHLQQQILETELVHKTEKITHFAQQMNRIDEFLQSLKIEIKQLRTLNGKADFLEKINDLALRLKQNTEVRNHLREFAILTEKSNQKLLYQIEKRFPKLTEDEKQLLMFLRANMSSKEIALHFNISEESVHTKRYRLRKHLCMSTGQDFQDFFAQFGEAE